MLTICRRVLLLSLIVVIELLSSSRLVLAQGSKEDFDRAQALQERSPIYLAGRERSIRPPGVPIVNTLPL